MSTSFRVKSKLKRDPILLINAKAQHSAFDQCPLQALNGSLMEFHSLYKIIIRRTKFQYPENLAHEKRGNWLPGRDDKKHELDQYAVCKEVLLGAVGTYSSMETNAGHRLVHS